ncbi:COMM domain-containing protein 4 isoform X2 [Bactrocera dorsalis]|uniref:COMM domain-containing protein 4 isoform X1 n=2 Tax=Bactrocera dorsalis TaxID=27457 RepID=A0A6J0RKH2_BACDO|nr:COMM domain-containing protein 4 isoform X1 [Bactrocera dorsalis]XP_049313418.1 COMM domain-containing protein 4 isoform X1 [Bactrocera dorsalis]XP_049313419.1 COMM domain-containing protein 4 isoform X2 [Bactrocera dorsalis]
MKFRFCGDGDCPDWVLAEIISTLSMLSAQNLETLAGLVAKRIVGAQFEENAIKAITADLSNDGKSAVACIHFLLINASRHAVSEAVFSEEIQQLGLPKEHAASMCRVLATNVTQIRQRLQDKAFRINELSSVRFIPPSSEQPDNTVGCVKFELKIAQELVDGLPEDTTHVLNIERANVEALLDELKEVRSTLQQYSWRQKDKTDV